VTQPETATENADAARLLVGRVLERLSPQARLVITLLEIEDRSVKEIAQLTGWSVPLVKVRAFRARAEMRKVLAKMTTDKYL
jgi:RNA polymerase sigma-70 factor (ECF subfamily)